MKCFRTTTWGPEFKCKHAQEDIGSPYRGDGRMEVIVSLIRKSEKQWEWAACVCKRNVQQRWEPSSPDLQTELPFPWHTCTVPCCWYARSPQGGPEGDASSGPASSPAGFAVLCPKVGQGESDLSAGGLQFQTCSVTATAHLHFFNADMLFLQ